MVHGKYTDLFEEKWTKLNNLSSVTFQVGLRSWCCNKILQIRKRNVLCPSNTFQATPMVSINNGCKLKFVDCNKEDLYRMMI